MKVKLLKKVRKQYKINYREKPYDFKWTNSGIINYNYQLKIPNRRRYMFCDIFLASGFKSINDAKDYIIYDLRRNYPNLGNYNRQRKIKETEHKVWYNE